MTIAKHTIAAFKGRQERDTSPAGNYSAKQDPCSPEGFVCPRILPGCLQGILQTSFYPCGKRRKLQSIFFALFPPSCFPIWVVLLVSCQYLISLGRCCEIGGQAHGDVRKIPKASRPTPGFGKCIVKIKLGIHIFSGVVG